MITAFPGIGMHRASKWALEGFSQSPGVGGGGPGDQGHRHRARGLLDGLERLWHAELGRLLPDVWTGERQRGVQLHRLDEAVETREERYGQRAWVRQLSAPSSAHTSIGS